MEFIPVPDTIMVELRYLLAGQKVENTLYFRNESGPWAQQEAATFAQTIGAWWDANIRPEQSSDLSLREVYITDLSAVNGWTVTVPLVPPSPGGQAEEALPNNVAACVSFRTAYRGRSARGRNYVPGLVGSQVLGSTINQLTATALVAGYNELIAIVQPLNVSWVVVSRFSGGLPRTAGLTFSINAAIMVDNYLDSQRRRLPGRGQ